jgi:serine/threonine protein phosphatase PrpC
MSDRGRVRTINEDRFAILAPHEAKNARWTVLVVADGVGGHRGGDVASSLVITELRKWFAADGVPSESKECASTACLASAIHAANETVFTAATGTPELAGMASTVTALTVVGDQAYLGHVGDSRAYLVRGGGIEQLSHDDTWVASAIATGQIAASEASTHPYKHVLTQAVGSGAEIAVETAVVELVSRDRLLLCTDGLTNVVDDREILQLVTRHREPGEAARRLVRLANQRGGRDNVTVLVARVERTRG